VPVLRGGHQPDRGGLGWDDPRRAAAAPAAMAQGPEGSRLTRPVHRESPRAPGAFIPAPRGEPKVQNVIYDALCLKNALDAAGREKPGTPVLRTGPLPHHHPSCWSVVGHARPDAGNRLFAPSSCHVPSDRPFRSVYPIGRCGCLAIVNVYRGCDVFNPSLREREESFSLVTRRASRPVSWTHGWERSPSGIGVSLAP